MNQPKIDGRANSFIFLAPHPAAPGDAMPDEPTMIRYDDFVRQLFKADTFQMMAAHAAMGIAGEAGEFTDAIKKHIMYNKPIDRANIIEELGDLRFYMQAAQNLFGITESAILQANADKLATRYAGLRYTDAAAIARADKAGASE